MSELEPEHYRCPKCGNETDSCGLVTVYTGAFQSRGEATYHPCLLCFMDWLRANIPEVERIEKKEEGE